MTNLKFTSKQTDFSLQTNLSVITHKQANFSLRPTLSLQTNKQTSVYKQT